MPVGPAGTAGQVHDTTMPRPHGRLSCPTGRGLVRPRCEPGEDRHRCESGGALNARPALGAVVPGHAAKPGGGRPPPDSRTLTRPVSAQSAGRRRQRGEIETVPFRPLPVGRKGTVFCSPQVRRRFRAVPSVRLQHRGGVVDGTSHSSCSRRLVAFRTVGSKSVPPPTPHRVSGRPRQIRGEGELWGHIPGIGRVVNDPGSLFAGRHQSSPKGLKILWSRR